jgi:hypothetical protein
MTGRCFTKMAKVAYLFSLTDVFFCNFLDHKILESHLLNLVL